MDELIVKSLQGRASEQELEVLRRWRADSPKNEERYLHFARLWRATADAGGWRPGRVAPPTARHVVDSAAPPTFRERWQGKHRMLAAAALIILSLGVGYLVGDKQGDATLPPAVAGEVVTGVGETSTAHLPDGTVVRLAPESRLTMPVDPSSRRVLLEGTAFFAVAPDSLDPFVVVTPAGDARVMGTRFELSSRASDLRLVVVEGRVALESGGREVEVQRSEVSHVWAGGTPVVRPTDDVWALMDWLGGFLAFEATPLHDVSSELQQRFGVTLVFDDPTLADQTVSVWFGDEGIEQVASVLCRLVEATCTVKESSVRMERSE